MKKSVVATIRFSRLEMRELAQYLRRNPSFESISSLGRVATMEFIHTRKALTLEPNHLEQQRQRRPWFLWDYDLTEAQVHELLTHAPFDQRRWLLARMLERLKPDEIVRYVPLEAIQHALPHLRLDEKVKRHWEEAIAVWTQPAPRS